MKTENCNSRNANLNLKQNTNNNKVTDTSEGDQMKLSWDRLFFKQIIHTERRQEREQEEATE